jgi:predicted transcriptional regulator
MEVLWNLGSGSVREVQESLPRKKRPAYTTVQTMVYRLEEKGALRRVKKIGNAHIFEPLISRQSTHRKLVEEMLEIFGGSARPLMAHLVDAGKLDLSDVRAMEEMLADTEPKSAARTNPKGKKR